MINYQDLLKSMSKYCSTDPDDICHLFLGVGVEDIREKVILAPSWEPDVFDELDEFELLFSGYRKVWKSNEYTYIITGMGASMVMDVVLALGLTKCKQIIFVGSVGALEQSMNIGDIVIPEYSICGDGASSYIGNKFGDKVYPCSKLNGELKRTTINICNENNVKYHSGINYSIDTIFAQFYHLDSILAMGCNTIEMETAAAFIAARLCDISIAALFSVSDNTIINKSLISGRSNEEVEYRRFVRHHMFPKIIKVVL